MLPTTFEGNQKQPLSIPTGWSIVYKKALKERTERTIPQERKSFRNCCLKGLGVCSSQGSSKII